MANPDALEYSDVVRIYGTPSIHQVTNAIVRRPAVYGYLSIHSPFMTIAYACEMTLAKGRILYEVYSNEDQYTRLGYLLPCAELIAAHGHASVNVLSPWKTQSLRDQENLHDAHTLIKRLFPRISAFSAKIIAESTLKRSGNRLTKHMIEDYVLDHALHYWTSYDFRIDNMGQSLMTAEKTVQPRLQEVVSSWLPRDESVARLLLKHGLMDAS